MEHFSLVNMKHFTTDIVCLYKKLVKDKRVGIYFL